MKDREVSENLLLAGRQRALKASREGPSARM
jgi:hypothetical protein